MNNMESQFELTQEGTILTINLGEELATANATALYGQRNSADGGNQQLS